MAVYAIGDLQGCLDPLKRLLDAVGFDPARDRLWFCGDLVNRGPDSLEALRFVHGLGDLATTVLGNHDLHLLAVAWSPARDLKPRDTLHEVLAAPDREELLEWLRHRPVLHYDAALGFCMVHAGLPPQWDLPEARAAATELEAVLRGPELAEFLPRMYGDAPNRWSDDLAGTDRLRFIVNCFTRLRYCRPDGSLDLAEKGPPDSTAAAGLVPWFRMPGRRSRATRLIFGHWSSFGFVAEDQVWGLDTGCVWGGRLTALALGAEPVATTVDCAPQGVAARG